MQSRTWLLVTLLLLTGLVSRCQDTAYQRVMAGPDDSAKVIRLANYAYSFADKDRARARKLYDTLLALSNKLDYPYWIGMSLFNIGNLYAREAKDSLALDTYYKALDQLKQTNRQDQIASCYLNIAAISGRMGMIDQQINADLTAIRILEPSRHKDLLMYAYNSLGAIFYNHDDYTKGLSYFQKSVELGKEIKDSVSIVSAYLGITNCLSSLKQYDSAYISAREGLRIANATQNQYDLSIAHTAFTQLYHKWGKGEKVLEHAEKILQYSTAAGDVQYQLIAYMAYADGYALLGNHKQRIAYLNKGLEIGEKSNTVIQLDDIYKGLSEAYEGLQDYKKAMTYHKLYVVNYDSTNGVKHKQNAASLEVKYRTAQKEKELAAQQLELVKSRQYTYASVGATIMLLLVSGMGLIQYRNKKKEYAREMASLQKDKEIQLLQAVMQGEEKERTRVAKDLHDGVAGMLAASKMHFNSIGTQYAELIQLSAFKQGLNLLDEAATEVRKTSHNLMPEILLQYGLDQAIRRYCSNINNSRAISITYDSWGEINRYKDSFELSVYRIVQELLNNIVKHSKATQALVQVSQQNEVLSITIEDNGVGMQENKGMDGTGLQSLASRAKAMNGKIELESRPGHGVCAYLEFDISEMEKTASHATN